MKDDKLLHCLTFESRLFEIWTAKYLTVEKRLYLTKMQISIISAFFQLAPILSTSARVMFTEFLASDHWSVLQICTKLIDSARGTQTVTMVTIPVWSMHTTVICSLLLHATTCVRSGPPTIQFLCVAVILSTINMYKLNVVDEI